jgi:hypothetical protein
MAHKVYGAIVKAIRSGRLKEPFSKKDFENSCPGLGHGTYNAFLDKHAVDNPSRVWVTGSDLSKVLIQRQKIAK